MKKKHSDYFELLKKRIIDDHILTPELSELYKSLFLFHEKYIEKLSSLDWKVQFVNKNNKLPLINSSKIKFTPENRSSLQESLFELIDIVTKNQGGLDFSRMVDVLKDNERHYEDIIKNLLSGEFEELQKLSREFKMGIEELIFLSINWFKPFLIAVRNMYCDTIDTSGWEKTHCPVCGYFSDISKIIESRDNARMLHCGFCEYEWKFPRLVCAVCENKDMDTQGYLVHEDDARYRIDYCDKCMGFIKTIRIPGKDEESRYDLTVENLITNFLDASAIEMGYNRP
ncbi:formate dehydrogenase accessory protein FdhE [Spirochaetota bacterium]